MKKTVILPNIESNQTAGFDTEIMVLVKDWLDKKIDFIQTIWPKSAEVNLQNKSLNNIEIAHQIIQVLTHKSFNYRSKKNIEEIIPKVKEKLLQQLNTGNNLNFYLLYNGGYRSGIYPNKLDLTFEPNQTELMLLYQIALFKAKLLKIYPNCHLKFNIVINNGVAKWVNDISITATTNYTNKLRKIIKFFGAEEDVKVLLQSELPDYINDFSFEKATSTNSISTEEHEIVERFLGKTCTKNEAQQRLDLYQKAEEKWAEDLYPLINENNGIVMRQIAHPDMLSFRPFPGGAIRIQNGNFGFEYFENKLHPKLITSKDLLVNEVKYVPYNLRF